MNVQLLKTTLSWNKWLIYHYLSLLWQTFTTHFVTNCDHAHLNKSMKNDASISNTCVGLRFALAADAHNAQFSDKNNCKKPCHTVSLTWANMCLVSVTCSFGLGLYLGTYKRIDHQNTGLVYKNFCSTLQYITKSKETRIKNKFWI